MEKNRKFSESSMYKPIEEYFTSNGYKVNAEVNGCDVVATRNDEIVVIEMKVHFSLELVYQAIERQKITNIVYVAIPRMTKFSKYENMLKLLKRLELGLIVVSMDSPIPKMEVVLCPSNSKVLRASKMKEKVIEEVRGRTFANLNEGGSRAKRLNTAFREKSIKVACSLERAGICSATDLVRTYGCGQDTINILYHNYYGWFDRVSRGNYSLSEKGKNDLLEDEQFREIVKHYRDEIEKEFKDKTIPH